MIRIAFIAFLCLLALFIGGFFWYVTRFQSESVISDLANADTVIVLTGGTNRIKQGLNILQAGKADHLFISGVGEGIALKDLAQNHPGIVGFEERITLGREANNTRGNASEVRRYLLANQLESIILVTSYYHMPRSLLEHRAMLPTVHIIPFSVQPDRVEHGDWWMQPATIRLYFTEYYKYLASLILPGY